MILGNNPCSWAHLCSPLGHAKWHGLTPTDLVFPFFLFAVGNVMAFVMPRLREAGDAAFWTKVLKRTALIFGIGLLLNWWPFVRWEGEAMAFTHWGSTDAHERGIRTIGVLRWYASAFCLCGKGR